MQNDGGTSIPSHIVKARHPHNASCSWWFAVLKNVASLRKSKLDRLRDDAGWTDGLTDVWTDKYDMSGENKMTG